VARTSIRETGARFSVVMMATPQGAKRTLDDMGDDVQQQTAKAPRIEQAEDRRESVGEGTSVESSDIGAVLKSLQVSIDAFKRIDPSSVGEDDYVAACKSVDELAKAVELIEAQREALANPPPAEEPIPFENLVSSLTFLSPKDMAAAAQVSRHFQRAVPEAVRERLTALARHEDEDEDGDAFFELRCGDRLTPDFLQRVEDDYKRVPRLLAKLKPRPGKKHDQRMKRIADAHHEVHYLFNGLLWDKLEEFLELEELEEDRLDCGQIIQWLDQAQIPEEELGQHDQADVLAHYLKCYPKSTYGRVYGLSLMKQMPAADIEKHQGILVPYLLSDNSVFEQERSLEALSKVAQGKFTGPTKEAIEAITKLKFKPSDLYRYERRMVELARKILTRILKETPS
jgi:hypothetical protein